MATLSGIDYNGPGWSVPTELWPAAVTRTRSRKWGTTDREAHMAFTEKQVEKYKTDGHCPYCDGTDLNNILTYTDHEQTVECENCGRKWVEILEITGIEPLEDR